MKTKILDRRQDKQGTCFLCSVSLEDYISALPRTYQDYEIQREIVANVYLDRLVDTVVERDHIPPIVLVVGQADYHRRGDELQISTFKILDGLQRTVRLKAIRATVDFCLKLGPRSDYLTWNKFKLSREFAADLREIDSNVDILRKLLELRESGGEEALSECFGSNHQWFEIWTGLSPRAEVQLMLKLNAGHKPVKTRHQLELLFLNLLPILRSGEGGTFNLVREKEMTSTQFSKSREVGQFHFASVITALLSFYDGRPVAPSTGLIQQIQSSDGGLEAYSEFTEPEFLKQFVAFLVRTDERVADQFKGMGVLWMGREVTLAGLFGALGAYSQETKQDPVAAMHKFSEVMKARPKVLNLEDFEEQRNNLDLSKVNIGATNRSAIFEAVKALLSRPQPARINWAEYFPGAAR